MENAAAVAQAQASIAVDSASDLDAASVSDAGYETDSLRSGSTSISSSVRDYMFENGRRYHRFREGTYNFPNDESEQEREDMKHAMMINLCQTLHFAPLGESPGTSWTWARGRERGRLIVSPRSHFQATKKSTGQTANEYVQWEIHIQELISWGWI